MSAKTANDEKEEAETSGDKDAEDNSSSPSFFKRPVVLILGGMVVIAGVVGGILYYLHARQFESTDDAFIDAHIVRVAPQIAAKVLKVLVDDNQPVKVGDVLVELDPRDFEVQVAKAKASLATAAGQLAEARAQVQVAEAGAGQAEAEIKVAAAKAANAEKDYNRSQELRENRVVSTQELDAATETKVSTGASLEAARRASRAGAAQVSLAQAQVQTAEARAGEARAALNQAEIQFSYATIRASEAGRVTDRSVTPGNFAQVGQALLAIVPRQVWVSANFKETQLTLMRPGQPVSIELDAYPDRKFSGHVESIQAGSGAAFSLLPPENATGNYVKIVQRMPVKIVFDELPPVDSPILLAPGMSVVPQVKVR